MVKLSALGLIAVVPLFVACGESPTQPSPAALHVASAMADHAWRTCASAAKYVVTDEAGLDAALQAAAPGDVIAIDGMIQITQPVMLVTQGVTLTCGAPGAGLTGHGPSDWGTLLYLGAPDVVVRGLNINAAYEDAIQGYPNPPYGVSPARAQVTDNQVACGPSNVDCVFFMNTTGIQVAHNQIECGLVCVYTWTVTDAVISDNYLAQPTPGYCGIWAQDTIDGTRIERNTLVSTSTLACNYPYGGAIRPNTGTGVVIADNVIRGTWLNGIATAKLSDSRIENNVVEDASWYGIFFSTFTRGVVLDPISRRVLVTGNKLTGRKAGIFAKWACDNVFVANLFGGAAPWAAVFDTTTGQNLFVGRGDVLDNGHFDCDGHGYVDPNLIIGRRIVMGATPDPVLSEVLPDVHGGTLH